MAKGLGIFNQYDIALVQVNVIDQLHNIVFFRRIY